MTRCFFAMFDYVTEDGEIAFMYYYVRFQLLITRFLFISLLFSSENSSKIDATLCSRINRLGICTLNHSCMWYLKMALK